MSADAAVSAIAARQHALVTAAQLAAAGLGRDAIARRLRDGRLQRRHRGVYLAAPLPAPLTPEMAAVPACGPAAVLSHRSAAAVWAIRPGPNRATDPHADAAGVWAIRPGPNRATDPHADTDLDVDITVVDRSSRSRRGIAVHRTRRLDPRDRTRRHGIPITAPARTLLDLAAILSRHELERALEQAELLRLVDRAALLDVLRRANGHHGAGALQAAAGDDRAPALTRSEAEARLLALIRAAELPAPRTNVRIAGFEVDFLWPAERLVIEVDGYAFHASRRAFERDRLRDARLQATGLRVMRVTWRQIAGTPESLVARIAAGLATGTGGVWS